jgi:hypothetical protein
MFQLDTSIVLRAALAAGCASALAFTAPLDPVPLVACADAAPAVACEEAAAPSELDQLAALERAAPDLEGLRGGDVHLDSGETVLVVLGIVILIILIA